MPASVKNADCLLGGTFLQKFVYRIDLAAGELHLSPITATASGDSDTSTKGKDSKPKTASIPDEGTVINTPGRLGSDTRILIP